MTEVRRPDLLRPPMSETTRRRSGPPCSVLTPSGRIASRWDADLRARVNRRPLDDFVRNHSLLISREAPDPLVEGIELVCLFIIYPVLPHRTDWRALAYPEYFNVLGQAIAQISRGLGEAVQEPKLWRVAALRGMGRLLTPIMGIDMAAPVAAASISPFGFQTDNAMPMEETIKALSICALTNGAEGDLGALRTVVSEHLSSALRGGAAALSTAPLMLTTSAELPSNH